MEVGILIARSLETVRETLSIGYDQQVGLEGNSGEAADALKGSGSY